MRGLAAYAAWRQDETAKAAARAAAEVFLSRGLFQRRRDGQPMDPSFLKLHHPLYWHYDLLGGLVAMAELDLLGDPRCEASAGPPGVEAPGRRRLGGRSQVLFDVQKAPSNTAAVDWGGTSTKRMNPWVTVQALAVLTAAGRLEV